MNRSFAVSHTREQIQDELYTIVDYGGKVLDVDEFIERIEQSKSRPLKVLTDGEHWHTVEAVSEKVLDKIEEKLREKGYLR